MCDCVWSLFSSKSKTTNKNQMHRHGSLSLLMKVLSVFIKNVKWMWTFAIEMVKKMLISQSVQTQSIWETKSWMQSKIYIWENPLVWMDPAWTEMCLTWLCHCVLVFFRCIFFMVPSKPQWSKALCKIFGESPARQDVYLREGTSEEFPMTFCSARWIKDQPDADRALEVWPSVMPTVQHWVTFSKSNRPKNNESYNTLVKDHQDL